MTADVPESFLQDHPWMAVLIGVAGMIVALGAAWTVVRRVTQSSFDDAVWASMQRKSPELEQHLRHHVFKDDLADREHTDRTARQALRLSKQNAQVIAQILEVQQHSMAATGEVPQLRAEVGALATSVERLTCSVGEIGGGVQRMSGILEEMRRISGGVVIPHGATVPVGR